MKADERESLAGASVLVTGGTGKIGRLLVPALLERGAEVSVLTRHPEGASRLWPAARVDCRRGDLTAPATLPAALRGVSCVFHLASHNPPPQAPDIYAAAEHWPVTAAGTGHLVQAAQETGVRRLIYLSSVKAMGDAAAAGPEPATEDTPPAPDSLYGRAKLAAERSVLAAGTAGIGVCVLRLPMVYGLAGEGNLWRMIAAVAARRFPPWPRVENHRSAVHVEDAIAAAILAATSRKACGRTYLVTDGAHYSTRFIYEQIRRALGRPPPPWATPPWVLWSAATAGTLVTRFSGRRLALDRAGLRKLMGNAWFSSERIQHELGFRPRHRLEETIPWLVGEYLAGRP